MPLDWDTIEEGDDLMPERSYLEKDHVRAYAHMNGAPFARFTDDEGARKEGLPGMIAPGNMSMGLIASFVERWAGPRSLVRLGTTFRGLVLPDNTITLYGVVTEKNEDARTVEIDVWMESHEEERLVIGTATVRIP
jgi:acyl dehydratase